MGRQHKLTPTMLPLSVVCFNPTYRRWKGKLLTSSLSGLLSLLSIVRRVPTVVLLLFYKLEMLLKTVVVRE